MSGAPYLLAQLLDLCAFMLAAGVLVCLRWLVPPTGDFGSDLAEQVIRRLRSLLTIAMATLSLTSPILLLARVGQMSHSGLGDVGHSLPIVLFQTHYGSVWLIRAVALVAMWGGWAQGGPAGRHPRFLRLMLSAVAVFAWTYSASGHAADQGDFSWQEGIHWLHVLSVSLGAGTLAVLALVLSRLPASSIGHKAWITAIMKRLSSVAWATVLGVLVSGVLSAYSQLRGMHDLWDTAYGRMLLLKSLVVLSILSLGILNRIKVSPSLRAWSGVLSESRDGGLRETTTEDMERKHRYIMSIAAALIVFVLICTLLLASGTPPHGMRS